MTQEEFVKNIQTHHGIIWKICRLYGHTQQDREDLFQEIVVQLWKAVPKFQGLSKFSTWMYRVALNTAISDFRKKKRFPSDAEFASIDNTFNDEGKDEQIDLLYKAISRLPEIEKAIVMLYLENKNYEEMKEILGINTNNLRVKMNRIKEKLRGLTKTFTHGT